MNGPLLHDASLGISPALAALFLASGFAIGLLYFRCLWWSARLLANAQHMKMALVLSVGRFACLAAVLAWTSHAGALPLLLTALGLMIARPVAIGWNQRERSA